ncbi:MAG: hypothetical protein IPL83_01350 [Bdellovibrionales bacterium]|nr:hypothetical protein [Bdellovibrionales bacterium]
MLKDGELAVRYEEFISAESARIATAHQLEPSWVELVLRETAELTDQKADYWVPQVKQHGFNGELFFFPDLDEGAAFLSQEQLVDFFSNPLPKLKVRYATALNLKQTQPPFYSKQELVVILNKYRDFLNKHREEFVSKGYTESAFSFSCFNHFIPRTLLAQSFHDLMGAEIECDEHTPAANICDDLAPYRYRDLFSEKEWGAVLEGQTVGVRQLREKLFAFLLGTTSVAIESLQKNGIDGIYKSLSELLLKSFDPEGDDFKALYHIDQQVREEHAMSVDYIEYDESNPPPVSATEGPSYGSIDDILFFIASVAFETDTGCLRQAQIKLAPFLKKLPSGHSVFGLNFYQNSIGDKSRSFNDAIDYWAQAIEAQEAFFNNFDRELNSYLDGQWIDHITIQVSRQNKKALNEIMSRLSQAKDANTLLAKLLRLESEELSGERTTPTRTLGFSDDQVTKLGLAEYKVKNSSFAFDSQFRSLKFDGRAVGNFTINQVRAIKLLYSRHEGGNPDTPSEMIIDFYSSAGDRRATQLKVSSDIFPRHPLWKKFIVSRERGMYRIDTAWIPNEDDFLDSNQNQKLIGEVKPEKALSSKSKNRAG